MGADVTIRKQYGVPFESLTGAVENHIRLQYCYFAYEVVIRIWEIDSGSAR